MLARENLIHKKHIALIIPPTPSSTIYILIRSWHFITVITHLTCLKYGLNTQRNDFSCLSMFMFYRFIPQQALNQLFEKIMALDIDERHLLRLGHGEEELETEKDFSRWGQQTAGGKNTHIHRSVCLNKQKSTCANSDVFMCELISGLNVPYFHTHSWKQLSLYLMSVNLHSDGVTQYSHVPYHEPC